MSQTVVSIARIFIGLCFLALIVIGSARVQSDFQQDYVASSLLLQGHSVYSNIAVELSPGEYASHQNDHPPFIALVGIPFTVLSYSNAFILLGALSVVSLLVLCFLISKCLKLSLRARRHLYWISLFWFPVYACLANGQIAIILALIIFAAYYAEDQKHPYISGFLMAIATALKLSPGLLGFYYLERRNWKSLTAMILSFGLIVVLTYLSTAPGDIRYYFSATIPRVFSVYAGHAFNISLTGLAHKLFGIPSAYSPWMLRLTVLPEIARVLGYCLNILIFVVIVRLVIKRRSEASRLSAHIIFSCFLVAMLLLSPLTWSHAVVHLLFPLLVLWQQPQFQRGPLRWLLLLCILLLSFPDLFYNKFITWWYFPAEVPALLWGPMFLPTVGLLLIFSVLLSSLRLFRPKEFSHHP